MIATDRGDWRGANPFKESNTIANASQNVVGSNPSAGKDFFPKISIKVNLNEHGALVFVH